MIDLDRFKAVNDEHGHPTGDQVLVRLAGLLRARLRQADVVGRYGGEEFAVVLEDLTADEATRLVERLRTDFAADRAPLARRGRFPRHLQRGAGRSPGRRVRLRLGPRRGPRAVRGQRGRAQSRGRRPRALSVGARR